MNDDVGKRIDAISADIVRVNELSKANIADLEWAIVSVDELLVVDEQERRERFIRRLGVACGLVVVVLTGLTVLLVLRLLGVR